MAADEPPASQDTAPLAAPATPAAAGAIHPPELPATLSQTAHASCNRRHRQRRKRKARDILAAIRTLKTIEREQRPATPEEKQTLARFAGFGPVALSIFPDPVTGRYKDAGWQALGDELKTLLTPEEYDSAKRTTFNAFFTSPIVIAAMHEAIARLGVPGNATILEPGCGTGNFMARARKGPASSASSWIPSPAASPGAPPRPGHPHRELPRHQAARDASTR